MLKELFHRLWLILTWYIPDNYYIMLRYRVRLGVWPNLDNPRTFNEKLQWLKLHDRKPEYTQMVDKIEAKKYVATIIGKEHIIQTLAVYNNVDEIDFDKLPNQFVLKCTHDSGGQVICKDKTTLDKKAALKKLKRALNNNYYKYSREWPYKNVKPRILAEEYMTDNCDAVHVKSGNKINVEKLKSRELIDYKFFCFNGNPKLIYMAYGKKNHKSEFLSFLTMDWHFAPFKRNNYKQFPMLPMKPVHFEEMKDIASKLSKGHPFLRVDLYDTGGRVLFSELTFTPGGGYMLFDPPEWDCQMGDWLKLPEKNHDTN